MIYGATNVTATKLPNGTWQNDGALVRGVPFVVISNGTANGSTVMAGTLEAGVAKDQSFDPYLYQLTSSALPLAGDILAPDGIGMPPARGMTFIYLNERGQGQSVMGLPNMTFPGGIAVSFGAAFEFIYNTAQTWKQELVIPADSLELEVKFNQ